MSIWNNLYEAYKEKDNNKFDEYWAKLTEEDKKSTYFSYYYSLKNKISPDTKKKWKIMIKWKVLKCPNCGSKLELSDYNRKQINKLKNGEKQVNFICTYCWTNFSFSDKPFKSLFSDYSIWKEVEIEKKKLKISWAVRYKWTYMESDGWGKLEYIEWLAYDKNGEIYYISESIATDNEWWIYKGTEITKKVNFPFLVRSISIYNIKTDKWDYSVKEYDQVKVVQVYWNVNKWYKILEKVELYNFSNYTLEIERTANWVERNLYKKVNNWLFSSGWGSSNTWKILLYTWILFVILFLITWFNFLCAFFLWIIWTIILLWNKEKLDITTFIWMLFVVIYITFMICHISWWWSSWWGSYGWSSWWSSSYWGGK